MSYQTLDALGVRTVIGLNLATLPFKLILESNTVDDTANPSVSQDVVKRSGLALESVCQRHLTILNSFQSVP
jgi:hypothetical protein